MTTNDFEKIPGASWLKDAVAHIQKTAAPLIVERGDDKYAVTPDGTPHIIPCIKSCPAPIKVNSLDALLTLIRSEGSDTAAFPLYVSACTFSTVEVFGQYSIENNFVRPVYYKAVATDIPGWDEKETLELEEAKIALQTQFVKNPGSEYLLRILSSVTMQAEATIDDTGLVTSIVTKTGVALKNAETVQPINVLRPYRTFQEVEQPESMFLTRIYAQKGERPYVTFIEADGGMWRLAARKTVKEYLSDALKEEIEKGRVFVTL